MAKLPRLLKWTFSIAFILLVLLSLFRLCFYLVYHPASAAFPADAFLMGLRLDLRVAAIIAVAILLLCSIRALDPFRRPGAAGFWNIFLTIIFILLVLMYVVDFFHYDYLHQRLNASVLNYLQDAGISMGMVWQTYPVIRSLLLILLLTLLAWWLFRRLLRGFMRQRSVETRSSRFFYIPFAVLAGLAIWGTVSQFALRWSDVFMMKDPFKAQLALNPVQSFFSTLSFRSSTYDEKKTREAYSLMVPYLGISKPDSSKLDYSRFSTPAGPLPPGTKPNIVLVICESFSAYKSSMWGNPLNPTPYFDSLCRQGIFFNRCFTPSYGTARGIWATVTGIPDVEFPNTSSRNPALVDQQTIINAFKDYEKFYFIGGNASWANIRGLLKFNIEGLKLYEQDDYNAAKVDVWGISDKNVFLQANKILGTKQKPFFAIIQTADNHRPYTIPDEDKGAFKLVHLPEDTLKKWGYHGNDELNAFRYTDFSFRVFMEAARKQPYYQNTIFVFIGDHGIRGNAGTMFPKAWTEGSLTSYHVPLLFYSPLLKPTLNEAVCSQVDVLPSIAGLASIPHMNSGLGKNLFDPYVANDPFRSSTAFIIDPDEKRIGMMGGDYYFHEGLDGKRGTLMSLRNNDPVPEGRFRDSIVNRLKSFAEAYYQTSRYLLYHHKK